MLVLAAVQLLIDAHCCSVVKVDTKVGWISGFQ